MEIEKENIVILIVDDSPVSVSLLGEYLSEYKIKVASDGALAIELIDAGLIPDLILLDILMPEMNGYEVCEKLKQNPSTREIPIIFITQALDINNKVKGLHLGAVDYITKPFQLEEVKSRIETHIKLSFITKEFKNALKEKDKFFSIIAHDLKSPFQGFISLTQMMNENILDLSMHELQSIALNMQISAKRIYHLLENLLQWSLSKQGLKKYDPTEVNCDLLVRQNILLYQTKLSNKNVSLDISVDESLVCLIDEEMINTVIRNLLSNAIKFVNRGGKILITAEPFDESFILLSIKDDGIGIAQDEISSLFKIDNDNRKNGTAGEPSTGLGLILCKEFVERNGGKIWVTSVPGQGSTFSFTVQRIK